MMANPSAVIMFIFYIDFDAKGNVMTLNEI